MKKSDPRSLFTIFHEAINSPRYEPIPRKFGGWRIPKYVPHRFPIKGGISWREVMVRQMAGPNPLWGMVRVKADSAEKDAV